MDGSEHALLVVLVQLYLARVRSHSACLYLDKHHCSQCMHRVCTSDNHKHHLHIRRQVEDTVSSDTATGATVLRHYMHQGRSDRELLSHHQSLRQRLQRLCLWQMGPLACLSVESQTLPYVQQGLPSPAIATPSRLAPEPALQRMLWGSRCSCRDASVTGLASQVSCRAMTCIPLQMPVLPPPAASAYARHELLRTGHVHHVAHDDRGPPAYRCRRCCQT